MRLIPSEDDWVCFLDTDVCFLTSDIGHQLEEITKLYPDTGIFTSYVNRVGNRLQCFNGSPNEDPNILNHFRIAEQCQQTRRTTVIDIPEVIAGYFMLIRKGVWTRIGGCPEGIGILTVDNRLSRKILDQGLKIRLMCGVYVFHFYRLNKDIDDRSHIALPGQSQFQMRRKRINPIV